MFIDRVVIKIKAGNGGNGAVSFRREIYVPNGGPDGGNGGDGGDIVFEATSGMNTLNYFKYNKVFRAQNGEKGGTRNRTGASGSPLIIKVPCGTVVRDKVSGKIIADLYRDGQAEVVQKGGRGGRGNAAFATSTRQAPNFSQSGIVTKEHEVVLELKVIADVGIVGRPNAGKSTFLSVISNAVPKIADYPFTTLYPNLGVVEYADYSFVAADIPGLIEGAAEGAGLGHEFLRHVERTRLLVHIIDAADPEGIEPAQSFELINNELKKYSPDLARLPQIVALNKIELTEEPEKVSHEFKNKTGLEEVYLISAATKKGIKEIKGAIASKLRALPPERKVFEPEHRLDEEKENTFYVKKIGEGLFELTGGMIDNISRGVVLSDPHSLAYFQRALQEHGINDAMKKAGVKEGDTVIVSGIEFEYSE